VTEPIRTAAVGRIGPRPDDVTQPSSNLIVATFDRLDDAREAMRKLRQLERDDLVELEDAAVVERGCRRAAPVPGRGPAHDPSHRR
jgi:hypothetical protein